MSWIASGPTIKLPFTSKSPSKTKSSVIGLLIAITPLLSVMGEVALKCALTSLALGPVYVNTPVADAYVNDPSPPASVILNRDLESELNAPVVLLYVISPDALNKPLM